MKFLFIFFLAIKLLTATTASPTPIVLWHGMGDTCCVAFSLGYFKTYLESQLPGVYVLSLKIGNSTIEDFQNGYFMSPNSQIDYVCKLLAKDPELKNGFNAIGFSQGSQFLRAVVQRCGHQLPPIRNLISVGGQHQGVYGLPHCGALQHKSCNYIRELLNYAAYNSWVQESLVQATYWHDPLNQPEYARKSLFLAEINNEQTINSLYVDNLSRLEHFVMIKFSGDTIVQPRETEWFGFYEPGQATKMQALNASDIYMQDRLGLKKMDEAGKLVFVETAGDHLKFSEEWFTENIIKPYLQ